MPRVSVPVGIARLRQEVVKRLPEIWPNPAVTAAVVNRARSARSLKESARQRREMKFPRMPDESPCKKRAVRRVIMFLRGVAGRKWSSGGPSMRGARRSVESSFSCR